MTQLIAINISFHSIDFVVMNNLFTVNFSSSDGGSEYQDTTDGQSNDDHFFEANNANESQSDPGSIFSISESSMSSRPSSQTSTSSTFQLPSNIHFFHLTKDEETNLLTFCCDDDAEELLFTGKKSNKNSMVSIIKGKCEKFNQDDVMAELIYEKAINGEIKGFNLMKDKESILKISYDQKSTFVTDFSYSFDEVNKRWLITKEVLDQAVLFSDYAQNPPLVIVKFGEPSKIEIESMISTDPICIFAIAVAVYLIFVNFGMMIPA